ncbi:MAG: RNA-binding protein [Anaerolinea sp.]|nr:RNA-binding protein [Anaerolinea sp.]
MKIYVGNLPYSTREDELESAFSAYGEVVSVTIVMDRDSGRSRGFAFVEMASDSEGQAAIAGLNDSEMDGRTLKVNEARPQPDRPPRREGGGGFRGDRGGGYRGDRGGGGRDSRRGGGGRDRRDDNRGGNW